MVHIRRESFDEHYFGRIRLQFFEFRLWRWGAKLSRDEYGTSLALPMMGIRIARGRLK